MNPYFLKPAPTEECSRCLFTDDIAEIKGEQCEYCNLHDSLEKNAGDFEKDILPKIKGKKYDILIGISGGLDSSTLLYAAVTKWNLKPLAIHFNNGWNTKAAEHNMQSLTDKLGVDLITYKVNKIEYDLLNQSFLECGTCDLDIPNDIAMTKLMYETADKYGIKWIGNGHDFKEEGSTPKGFTYMDAKYVSDVYEQFTGDKLKNYPLFTFWDQIKYALKGIKQVRPFHSEKIHTVRHNWEREMKQFIGWKDYGFKHSENIYTEFVGSFVLPSKFNIDKRIVYYSALVRSGKLSKSQAKILMQEQPRFDLSKLPAGIYDAVGSNIVDRKEFAHYNFKKWKWVIWILWKLQVVPQTFFVKYCK